MTTATGSGLEPWMLQTRYRPGQTEGHYESFYLRGNHPQRPRAFWIRYTIFAPQKRSEAAIGELWAVFFDGETGRHVVAKEEHPLATCAFARDRFSARVGGAELEPGRLAGTAAGPQQTIGWDLRYGAGDPPLFLMPRPSYDGSFPAAKSLVAVPLTRFDGALVVEGRRVEIADWVGSVNHNWGRQHTDRYAFGQVAGFDQAPDTFLEIVTAQIKVGPVRLPPVTNLSLRHQGVTHALVNPLKGLRADARYGYFSWRFAHADARVHITGCIEADAADFVALTYYNPPGGTKQCLNTKIARCLLRVTDRRTGKTEELTARHRALFEILTDDRDHGIDVRA